jgi:hypothetical protein
MITSDYVFHGRMGPGHWALTPGQTQPGGDAGWAGACQPIGPGPWAHTIFRFYYFIKCVFLFCFYYVIIRYRLFTTKQKKHIKIISIYTYTFD